jgi:hypothetical protein
LAIIESSIEKSHFVKKISEKPGIAEAAIWEDLKKVKVEAGVSGQSAAFSNSDKATLYPALAKADSIGRRILGVINWQEKDTEKVIDINKAKERVREIIGQEDFNKWQFLAENVINEATFEAEQYYEKKKLQEVLDELLQELEKEYVTKKLSQAKTPEEQNLLIKKLAKLK